jgi:predicted alpha/beta superfamily hydrolase
MKLLFIFMIILMSVNIQAQNGHSSPTIKSAGQVMNVKSIQIKSSILNESREIYISLPPNYNQNVHDYPIILILDGEFMFDIARSMTTLWASRNYMPESIIIGLPNPTNDKRFEMALEVKGDNGKVYYQGGGDPKTYIQFFKNELFPFLEKHYRVNTNRTIVGLSPTSGAVYQAFWGDSDLFRHYISINGGISSHLTSGRTVGETLISSLKNHKNSTLYIGQPKRVKEIQDARELNQKKFIKNFNHGSSSNMRLKVDNLEGESGYGVVVRSLFNAFRFIYPRDIYNINYSEILDSKVPAKEIEKIYDDLSNRYGYKIYPVEAAHNTFYNLYHMMRRLINTNRLEEAKQLVQLGLKYYPNSSKFYYRLAQINQAENDNKNARVHLKKSIRLAKIYDNENLDILTAELDELLN